MHDNSGYVKSNNLRARVLIVRPKDAVAELATQADTASTSLTKVADNATLSGGARKQIPSRRKSQTKGIRKSKKN